MNIFLTVKTVISSTRGFSCLIAFTVLSVFTTSAQQTEEKMPGSYAYLLYMPEDGVPPFPLILYLHGSGERGDDPSLVKKNGPPAFLDDTTGFHFAVISPQCPANTRWEAQNLNAFLDFAISTYPIDTNRIYLTGLSMGGQGTWELAMLAPDRFAAIAPVCGRQFIEDPTPLKTLPVWVFHGAKDGVVSPEFSISIVGKLQALGADVKFTLYPDANHNSWDATYSNPALYAWFMTYKK
jgi:predicted peptidase